MRRPEQAGEADVREGNGAAVSPAARHAEEASAGSTTLERFDLIMTSDSLKACVTGNPELICRFRHTSPSQAVKPGELEVLFCMQSAQGIAYPRPKHSYVKDLKARNSIALADSGTPDR
jgi:hypothetical protein